MEKAIKREAKEELTLEVEPIKILDVFSEPLEIQWGYLNHSV